ncbi:hypothetical protein ABRY23_12820 [Melioribacteraceae bacterium 4301-Me]|uniref:hypothetical protein n=1 Tax=Pyranulibacter aquaticus TaxID=3163344 RepID=UPI00359B3AF3
MNKKFGMLPFFIKENFFQAPLLLWIIIVFITSFIIITARIEFHNSNYFTIYIFNQPFPVADNGSIWIGYLYNILLMLCIIAFPKPILEMIDKKRISLILSKPVSRNNFILQNIISVAVCLYLYVLIAAFFFSITAIVKFSTFPIYFILSLLILPLILTAVYIIILQVTLQFNSFGLSVLVLIIYCFLITKALANRTSFFTMLGIKNELIKRIVDIIFYVTPRVSESIDILFFILKQKAINLCRLLGIMFSFVPISLVLIRHINKRQF